MKRFRKILAALLSAAMLICPMSVSADESITPFSVQLLQMDTAQKRSAQMLVKDGKVYINEADILLLGDTIGTAIVVGSDFGNYALTADGKTAVYFQDDELVTGPDGGTYYPYVQTMGGLGIHTAWDRNTLYVEQGGQFSELCSIMEEIRTNSQYNMAYWQNSKEFGFTKNFAIAVDALKNGLFGVVKYGSGFAEHTQYYDALLRIILPSHEEDLAASGLLFQATDLIDEYIGDNAGDVLEAHLKNIGDSTEWERLDEYRKVKEQADALSLALDMYDFTSAQMQGLLELIYVTNHAQSVDQSLKHALQLLDHSVNDESQKHLSDAVDMVIDNLDENVDAGIKWLRQGVMALDGLVSDHTVDIKTGNVVVDIAANTILENNEAYQYLVAGGQEKAAATVTAVRLLEIQKQCISAYKESLYQYRLADEIANSGKYLQRRERYAKDMHSLMIMYLRAGVEAYRALDLDIDDPAFTRTVHSAIENMNNRLAELARFDASEFECVADAQKTEKALLEYAKNPQIIVPFYSEKTDTVWGHAQNIEEAEILRAQHPYGLNTHGSPDREEDPINSYILYGNWGKPDYNYLYTFHTGVWSLTDLEMGLDADYGELVCDSENPYCYHLYSMYSQEYVGYVILTGEKTLYVEGHDEPFTYIPLDELPI